MFEKLVELVGRGDVGERGEGTLQHAVIDVFDLDDRVLDPIFANAICENAGEGDTHVVLGLNLGHLDLDDDVLNGHVVEGAVEDWFDEAEACAERLHIAAEQQHRAALPFVHDVDPAEEVPDCHGEQPEPDRQDAGRLWQRLVGHLVAGNDNVAIVRDIGHRRDDEVVHVRHRMEVVPSEEECGDDNKAGYEHIATHLVTPCIDCVAKERLSVF